MTAATPRVRLSTSGSRLLQLAARFPLATFLILGFSLGYALAFLWGLAYRGVIPAIGALYAAQYPEHINRLVLVTPRHRQRVQRRPPTSNFP
jgi:pimeloyl-ACP methyl ester carboxylesterase